MQLFQRAEHDLDERLIKALSDLDNKPKTYDSFIELFCIGFQAKYHGMLEEGIMGKHISLSKQFSQHYLTFIKYTVQDKISKEQKNSIYVSAIPNENPNINYSICSIYAHTTDKIILQRPQIEIEQIQPYKSMFKTRSNNDIDITINFPNIENN